MEIPLSDDSDIGITILLTRTIQSLSFNRMSPHLTKLTHEKTCEMPKANYLAQFAKVLPSISKTNKT